MDKLEVDAGVEDKPIVRWSENADRCFIRKALTGIVVQH